MGIMLSTAGLELGIAVAIGTFLGQYLDKTFDTTPWLTLGLLLAGTTAGFLNLFRLVKRAEKRTFSNENDTDHTPNELP